MKSFSVKQLLPVRTKIIKAEKFKQYHKILLENSNEIEKIAIIAPRLGKKDFGKVEIHFKNPIIYE